MKHKDNCEQLFEYLRSILYDDKVNALQIDDLEPAFEKLGKGMQYLEQAVREMKEYSAAISVGNLSVEAPPRENFLCKNLKNIHANLNHLSWQAKQVAKGDYSQSVSYLGEFSEAFNTMTKQLKEREQYLKQEAEREKTHANMVESYNQLLIQLIERSKEDILVLSKDRQETLYCSGKSLSDSKHREIYEICRERLAEKLAEVEAEENACECEWEWEEQVSDHRYYYVATGFMEWQGEKAYAHIIRDITEEKEREEKLEEKAYLDALTGIGNRNLLVGKMKEFLEKSEKFVFCYCDLDHLKYINDTYGHEEGDWYLNHFVDIVQEQIRKKDLFARIGGDEFCIAIEECDKTYLRERMQMIQEAFRTRVERPYLKDFSFGIIDSFEFPVKASVHELIQEADKRMYSQKEEHRRALELHNRT